MDERPPEQPPLSAEDIKQFGAVLAHFLRARDVSRAELERRTGIPSGGLSHILKRKRPLRGEHLCLAAQALAVNPEDLAPTEALLELLRVSRVDPQTRRLLDENTDLRVSVEKLAVEASTLQATLARAFQERDHAQQEVAALKDQRTHQDALLAKLGGQLAKREARVCVLEAEFEAERASRASATSASARWRERCVELEARLRQIQLAYDGAVRHEKSEGSRILVAAFAGLGLGIAASGRHGPDD